MVMLCNTESRGVWIIDELLYNIAFSLLGIPVYVVVLDRLIGLEIIVLTTDLEIAGSIPGTSTTLNVD